ncbi:hypothetical protein BJ508DRAFT_341197 [Ascobolus immersus RN42]|uniref:Uncharacterized protein n=1 Tax=Ascobolus immersus RN42 TaxID=1160509 RepID=A0A3N4HHS9_ASCIM|nr:hypothetical protein BJ508DRAFT_341197 [Ascobolus immersus RN42]
MAVPTNTPATSAGGSIGPGPASRPPSLFNQLFSGGKKERDDAASVTSRRNSTASSVYRPDVRLSVQSAGGTPPPDPHNTPEARLATLAETAKDLLDRVYTAYKKRTLATSEALSEQSALRDELEGARLRTRILESKLEKEAELHRSELEQKDEALRLMQEKLQRLEMQLSSEPPTPSDETPTPRAGSASGLDKRISSSTTSDSGFESDADSLFSRTTSPSDSTLSPSDSTLTLSHCPHCNSHLRPPSITSPSSPSPLREATAVSEEELGNVRVPSPAQSKWQQALAAMVKKTVPAEQGEVEALRGENRFLRGRVVELEGAVGEALGVLGGWRT